MTNPKASIIIVNWNGKRYLKDCLTSIFNQTYTDYEVIFVDNASTDDSVKYVEENFPMAKIIVNKENLGFAEGNNVGITASKGKYIITLNNDTKVESKWMAELIKVVEKDEKIGICASKILLMDKPNIIFSTGFIFKFGFVIGDRGYLKEDLGQYDKITKVFGACACSALYRKKMLDEIGYFDETYFLYHEDNDLSWRAHNAGWQAEYVPTSICYHKSGGTPKDSTINKMIKRNSVRTLCKNSSSVFLLILFVLREIFWLNKSIVEYVTGKKDIYFGQYLYGLSIIPFEWRRANKLRISKKNMSNNQKK